MKKRLLSISILFAIATSLCQAQTPMLWGMTSQGGTNDSGVIFNYNITTGTETNVHSFNGVDGNDPNGSLFKSNNGLLYGMTVQGGDNSISSNGTIFSYNISGGINTVLYTFTDTAFGAVPGYGSVIQIGDSLLYGFTSAGGIYSYLFSGTIFSYNIFTGTETVLHSFGNGTDGNAPLGTPLLATNGMIYGMTGDGGTDSLGTIFSYSTTTGIETNLHNFHLDGQLPWGSLIQINDSLLYGLTSGTESNDSTDGTIFSYNILTNIVTVLHYFSINDSDGINPLGSLFKASNGLLYGMTESGGSSVSNAGIIFCYNISTGIETVLHRFSGGAVSGGTDGAYPYGSLIQVGDSLLYGMTSFGGTNGVGTIFSFNIFSGAETVLHSFSDTDGKYPYGALIAVYDTATGIKQLSANNEKLSVFPNPSSGQFTIRLSDKQNSYPVEVYNLVGEKIYQAILSNSQNTLNLSNQPAGMYFIYLQMDEGTATAKVLITK